MNPCTVCSTPIRSDQPSIVCSKCSQTYHPKCVGIGKRIFRKFCQEALDSWECYACKNEVYRRMAEGYRKMLDEMRKDGTSHSEERTRMCEDMADQVQDLNLNMKHMLNNYDVLLDTEQELLAEFESRLKEMKELNDEIRTLNEVLDDMNNSTVESAIDMICIGNIPEDDDSDGLSIARRIAKAIKVDFDESNITSASFFGRVDFNVMPSVSLNFSEPMSYEYWAQNYGDVAREAPKESVKMINYELLINAEEEDQGATNPEGN